MRKCKAFEFTALLLQLSAALCPFAELACGKKKVIAFIALTHSVHLVWEVLIEGLSSQLSWLHVFAFHSGGDWWRRFMAAWRLFSVF